MEESGACLQIQLMQCPSQPGMRCYIGADIRQVGSKLTPCWFLFYIMKLHLFPLTQGGSFMCWTWEMCTRISGMCGLEERKESTQQRLEVRWVAEQIPRKALRQDLKVLTDLRLCCSLNECQTCLLQQAQQRKGSLWVCCPKMEIYHLPVYGLSGSSLRFSSQAISRNWNYVQTSFCPS